MEKALSMHRDVVQSQELSGCIHLNETRRIYNHEIPCLICESAKTGKLFREIKNIKDKSTLTSISKFRSKPMYSSINLVNGNEKVKKHKKTRR
ncbi:hypothetical protein AX774_g3058 [Zancudomyces culisetae]|uniref:Uncharacterized protein n=1 Tax=Zancudomyces culisetae TaxID=1213189 RepID=A0A1R1PR70_ZANCU|nr:hypothetical protein AX774_g3058 [Zancudomyces culisetae]|eukprot:OMH83439.1 hypothetical protein AX774_g3058 [Zancudomyces culisetae]